MPYVDANKALSDPVKVGRLHYILEPFLKKPIEFKAKRKRAQAILDVALEKMDDSHIISALKSYQLLNKSTFNLLKGLDFNKICPIFTTSESLDPTGSYVCMDIFSEHVVLGEKILQIENELYKEFGHSDKQVLYLPVAPVLFPAITAYDNDEVILKHPFPDIFENYVNPCLQSDKPVSSISLERRLGQDLIGQKGIYQFKTLLFDSKSSKNVFVMRSGKTLEEIKDLERFIEDSVYVNKTLMANAYHNICEKLKLSKPITLYSQEGGYSGEIFDIGKIEKTTLGQITRNLSPLEAKTHGLCSDSALRILKSYLHKIRYG